jgi:hypothetical protein
VPRKAKLAWIRFLALAIAVVSLSMFPTISIPLGCVAWGWDEILLSRWLKRVDPDRVRGRVCSRFYLSWGLGRIGLMALAMMFGIIGLQVAAEGSPAQGNSKPPPPESVGCLLVSLTGFLLSSAVTSFAVVTALRDSVRIWVGPEARWARADAVWPPQCARPRGKSTNRTKRILIGFIITLSTTGLIVGLFSWPFFSVPATTSPTITVAIVLLLLIGLPVLILLLLEWLSARIIAPTPSACWSSVDRVDHRRG